MLPLFKKGQVALLLAMQVVVLSVRSQSIITTIAGTGVELVTLSGQII